MVAPETPTERDESEDRSDFLRFRSSRSISSISGAFLKNAQNRTSGAGGVVFLRRSANCSRRDCRPAGRRYQPTGSSSFCKGTTALRASKGQSVDRRLEKQRSCQRSGTRASSPARRRAGDVGSAACNLLWYLYIFWDGTLRVLTSFAGRRLSAAWRLFRH